MFICEYDLPGPGAMPGLHIGIWSEQHNATPNPTYNQAEGRAVEKTDHVVYKVHVQNMNPNQFCTNLRARVEWAGRNATHPAPGFPSNEICDYLDPSTHAAIAPPELHSLPIGPYGTIPVEGSDLRWMLFNRLSPCKQAGDQTVSGLTFDVHGMNPPADFNVRLRFEYDWVKEMPPMDHQSGEVKFQQSIHD
ncbi:MAG: hypothetical protein U0359_24565 [Byssovorax sp.]